MNVLEQFGIKPILLAAQIVNFFILLFILKKFLYGPILKVLDSRKKTIEESLKNAEEIERKLADAGEMADRIMANAAKESQKVMDETSKITAQVIDDAKIKADEIQKQAYGEVRASFEQEKEELEKSVREHIAGLIFMIIQKATGKVLSQKDQKLLIAESLKALKASD